jgi:glycosyltransferase involved in cell wall biosynthesis
MAYRFWHWSAFQLAQKVMKNQKFDLIHYLGPIGYREPGYMWRLSIPYVWGPIGGATHVPLALVSALPMAGKLKLVFRAAANWIQLRFSVRVRCALARADALLMATTENQEIFRNVLGRDGEYLPENGIVGPVILNVEKFKVMDKIRLVWIGSIEARKALVLLVRALAQCRYVDRFRVDVLGDGPLRSDLELQANDLGLESVFCWHGQTSRNQVRDFLDQAHLHVVTSVSEGNPTTIWEAMSCGVPTLALDHCGMHDTVLPGSGIKIAITDLDKIVGDMALALDRLAEAPAELRSMADQVVEHAADFHWDKRPEFFMSVYRRAMTKYHAS